MKTAEQFLEECKLRWKQTDPNMQSEVGAKQALIEALILYAEQAIDMCSKESDKALNGYVTSDASIDNFDAINNVKKLLK